MRLLIIVRFSHVVVFLIDHDCQESEFHCGGGQCIPDSYVCDFETDCDTGRDETEAQCGK